jgi:hypothetical protein
VCSSSPSKYVAVSKGRTEAFYEIISSSPCRLGWIIWEGKNQECKDVKSGTSMSTGGILIFRLCESEVHDTLILALPPVLSPTSSLVSPQCSSLSLHCALCAEMLEFWNSLALYSLKAFGHSFVTTFWPPTLWTHHFISLGLSFFLCKMETSFCTSRTGTMKQC